MIDPARTALLAMDFQVDILRTPPLAPDADDARARLDAAVVRAAVGIAAARRHGAAVIHVRHAFRSGHIDAMLNVPMGRFMRDQGVLVDGSPGAEIDPRVSPVEGERVVVKQTISALSGTGLDAALRTQGIDTLLLAGVVTHYVVEGTARQAADLGFHVVVLTDACASADQARHENTLKNLGPLATLSTVDAVWRKPA